MTEPAVEIRTSSAEQTRALGRRLAGLLRAGDVVVLDGPLGAGKTTLAQGIGAGLGVRSPVTSPTFVISRVHPSLGDGPALVHVDAYRLHDGAELDDLDLDATLADSVTVVEWGDGLADVLARDRLRVRLTRSSGPDASRERPPVSRLGEIEENRTITVQAVGPRWAGVRIQQVLLRARQQRSSGG